MIPSKASWTYSSCLHIYWHSSFPQPELPVKHCAFTLPVSHCFKILHLSSNQTNSGFCVLFGYVYHRKQSHFSVTILCISYFCCYCNTVQDRGTSLEIFILLWIRKQRTQPRSGNELWPLKLVPWWPTSPSYTLLSKVPPPPQIVASTGCKCLNL